jgi:hypothetical protein
MAKWTLRDGESGVTETVEGALYEARERAEAWAREGDYGEITSTIWVDVEIDDEDGDTVETVTVEIDPREPDCTAAEHHWIADGAKGFGYVLRGNGGGVISQAACVHCGTRRISDSWAQRPDTGEQGLDSVRYEDGEPPEPARWETIDEDEQIAIGEVCDCDGDGVGWRVRHGGAIEETLYEDEDEARERAEALVAEAAENEEA